MSHLIYITLYGETVGVILSRLDCTNNALTNIGLVSFKLNTIGVSIRKMSHFIDNGRVHVFDNVFFLDTIRVHIPCRDLCTYVKSYQYEYGSNGINSNNTKVYKRFFHLDTSTK
jgi:hypothetical protein